jgi:polar amino acid transport system ATP-binding protein
MNNAILSFENVSKRFRYLVVIDRVSLSVSAGEMVALIGPSGGGKSTMLRCASGLTAFDGGKVQVGPHVLSGGANGSAGRQLWRVFGMVFQDFQLFPHLTALENVIEAPMRVLGRLRGEAVVRGWELLRRVGLGDRGEAYPRQLSGGQKQRVAIARALAMEPRGLLCDEITSALDPELKYEVLRVLEALRMQGMTIVMVTHEIGFARRVANRVVVLADGKIVEEGPAADVLDKPRKPRTQAFLKQVLA